MISRAQFYKGRDTAYASELTSEIESNSILTLTRANLLLLTFYAANPKASTNRGCNSGWRPAAVNSAVPYAAKKSNHMIGKAIDIGDDDGELDKWLMTDAGQAELEKIGLWMEHPSATPRWCHIQTVPPASGRRVFHP